MKKKVPSKKLTSVEQGTVKVLVGIRDGMVALDFGNTVRWFACSSAAARELSALLIRHADHLDGVIPEACAK